MTKAKPKTELLIGRPGALTEQLNFRVSKATAKRVDKMQRERGLETRADLIRAVLREAGL